jgi:hypothetical protein
LNKNKSVCFKSELFAKKFHLAKRRLETKKSQKRVATNTPQIKIEGKTGATKKPQG